MSTLKTLAFHNPGILSDDDFIASFVARQALANRLLERLREIKPNGLANHQLILGQRGMGKTSMLRWLALGIRKDQELSSHFIPLSFREEQYNVNSLRMLWLNCLDSLGDWLEKNGDMDKAVTLDRQIAKLAQKTPQQDRDGQAALELFHDTCKAIGKRPLLLLDNIDLILNGLEKNQDWGFRRELQKNGGIVVVGASVAYLETANDPKAAFYDFFHIIKLEPLSREELLACLNHQARQRGEAGEKVLRILTRDSARIHTLYDLTGGNPRTLALLYALLELDAGDDVMNDLERLLDQVTGLYKARVEDLAPQARVVLDALALNWNPATATDLATTAALPVNTVSTQLERLQKNGIIEKVSVTSSNRAAYQLCERFFNIWYLMRHAPRRTRNRLRWLTEFLRSFYNPSQLETHARTLLTRQQCNGEYLLALSDAVTSQELRRSLCSQGCKMLNLKEEDWPTLVGEDISEGIANLLNKAIKYHEQGQFDKAEQACRKIIKLDPQYAGGWNNLGLLLRKKPDCYVEAEQAYRKAIGLDPKNAIPWFNLGNLCENNLSRFDEAEKAYRKAIELDPNNVMVLNNLGGLLRTLGRYDEAEQACRKAIEIDPKDAVPWFNLGILLGSDLGRFEEAERAYRKAIQLDPEDAVDVWNSLGSLLQELGRFNEAEQASRNAIKLDPKNSMSWHCLGNLLLEHPEHYDEAEKAFRMAIKFDPKNVNILIDLGILLQVPLGRYDEAEQTYRKAIELDPKNAGAWFILGILLQVNLGRYDEAEQAYRKAIEFNPNHADIWLYLGILLQDNLGRYDEAEQVYRKAIEINPKEIRAWNNLGILLVRLNHYDEAEQIYCKTIELDPQNDIAWNNLGNLQHDYLGNNAEAEVAYQKAMAQNPENGWVAANLAYLLFKQQRNEEAEPFYQQAVAKLPPHGAALLRAYRAIAYDNFGEAVQAFKEALDSNSPELFSNFHDDLLRILLFAKARKYGDRLLQWLDENGYRDRFWPVYAAYDAYLYGEERLKDINPEVRTAAKRIYDKLARFTQTKC